MAYNYGDFFRVLEVQRYPADLNELGRILGLLGPGHPDIPAVRIWNLLRDTCQTVIVESDYIDLDYRSGFGRLHYLRHFDTPRRCDRLHFFSTGIRSNQLINISKRIQSHYLATMVIRPLPGFRVGRTILSDRVLPSQPGLGEKFLTCQTTYPVNLAGNQLQISGTPFMQQDSLVSACASAALWVAGWHMAHRYSPDFRICFTPEITDMATKYAVTTGRSMPSVGLTLDQMMIAVRDMGYEPLALTSFASEKDARDKIYRYVESEIPVIISLFFPQAGGHAVTIVGHTFDETLDPDLTETTLRPGVKLTYCRSSDFVPAFIVQDDAIGPFRMMEFVSWDDAESAGIVSHQQSQQAKERGYACLAVFDRGTPIQGHAFLRAALVPLPPGVTLDGSGAEERAVALLTTWFGIIADRSKAAPQNLVLRTFLELSNKFKTRLGPGLGLPTRLRRLLRRHLMSRWVWVTEVSDIESVRTSRLAIGQIIQDCAGHPSPNFFDLLAAHLPPGQLLVRSPSGQPSWHTIPGYGAHPSFVRHRVE